MLTFEEIYEEQLAGQMPDPVVANFVGEMSKEAVLFRNSAKADTWVENYNHALNLCRITQRLRLEVGELSILDQVSRRKVAEVLEPVLDEVVVDSERFLVNYEESQRDWGRRALGNLRSRLDEALGQ